MWPWSTIIKLRARAAQAEAALAATRDTVNQLRRDVVTRRGERDEALRLRDVAYGRELQVREVCAQNAIDRDTAQAGCVALQARIDILTEQLLKAQKNDTRGPNGRFVKAP